MSKYPARWKSVLLGALGCVFLLGAADAKASPLLDLAGDVLGCGGLQPGVVPSGAASAYFNPALLTDSPAGLRFGFMVLSQQIAIFLDGRPGTEFAIPAGIANAGHADGSRFDNYPIPTNDLQFGRAGDELSPGFAARPRQGAGSGQSTVSYEIFGLVLKLFDEHLALGAYGFVPNDGFTRLTAFYSDEREQYFTNSLHPELYSDRMTAPSMSFGAGVRLLDELSFGVGAALAFESDVASPSYVVDTGDLSKVLIDVDGKAIVSFSPNFGVRYTPIERLRLTATAHSPQSIKLSTNFTFLLANGVEQTSGINFVLNYTPWMFGLGGAFDILQSKSQDLTLAGTLTYAAWHTYIDRHGERPTPAYPWADTLSPTLGLRFRHDDLSTHVDLAYAPTPVPEQTGRTNYVDNDRVSTAVGGELGLPVMNTKVFVGLQLQAHRLLSRHQTKLPTPTSPSGKNLGPELVKDELPDDAHISGEPVQGAQGLQTNNPGWPGFGSKGWVYAASLYARLPI